MTRAPTTARSGVHNVYEAQARLAKASALVDVIDAQCMSHGIHPVEQAAEIAKAVRGWNLGHWIALAYHAGVHTPSATSIELVAKTYERRAAALRVA